MTKVGEKESTSLLPCCLIAVSGLDYCTPVLFVMVLHLIS